MDSLTQFALGAAVSTLCLGKTLGPRKAAILGGILGTLPDLDVFLPFDTPVDAFVLHRGWTHSILVHAIAAPLIGEFLVRMVGALRDHRALVWTTVFLCLATHALIDAMTVYGTRVFWPIYPDPVGVGSIFIIDPLFTLPLLVVVIWALARKAWSARLRYGLIGALSFSAAYLGLGVGLQAIIEDRAKAIFEQVGLKPAQVFAIAAPFNTVVWKVIGLESDQYHNLYLSFFDDDAEPRIYTHPRRAELIACLQVEDAVAKLQWFSRGFYRVDLEGNNIVVSDLRMGLTPDYVFQFAVAERASGVVQPIPPEQIASERETLEQDLEWLGERFWGRPAMRMAEAALNPAQDVVGLSSC